VTRRIFLSFVFSVVCPRVLLRLLPAGLLCHRGSPILP